MSGIIFYVKNRFLRIILGNKKILYQRSWLKHERRIDIERYKFYDINKRNLILTGVNNSKNGYFDLQFMKIYAKARLIRAPSNLSIILSTFYFLPTSGAVLPEIRNKKADSGTDRSEHCCFDDITGK